MVEKSAFIRVYPRPISCLLLSVEDTMPNIAEILSGQHGLAGVQQLLSGAPMRRVLRHALRDLMDQPDRLGACRLQRAKFKPGRKLTAYFDLDLRPQNGASACTRSIAVTWTRPESEIKAEPEATWQTLQAEAIQRGLAAPFRQLMMTVPAWGMKVEISPLDARYPQLVRLSEPAYVRDLLAVPDAGELSPSASDYAITSIRYRPGQRHVLRYAPIAAAGCPAGQGTVFAKLYPDPSCQRFLTMANQMADWLTTQTPDVTALRPLAYVPEDTTVLYPWANGVPLSQQLRRPNRTLSSCLTQVGAALRALHSAPSTYTQGLPSHDLAAEVKSITRTCEHIDLLLPAVGQTIHALLDHAQAYYATLPQEAPTFIHGDFKADHGLVAPSGDNVTSGRSQARLTLIDFDSCALADPAFDIGKFLADLDWWYTKYNQSGLTQAQNAFLAGYHLDPAHPRLRRAQVWQSLIQIKMTAHRVPLFDRDWSSHTTAMIDRGVAVLERCS
jgi:aminoglycoside phosphotransferase (APT) family kinase protein